MTNHMVPRLLASVSALLFLGAGCITIGGNRAGADGALFRTADRGERWEQRGALLSIGGANRTLATVSVDCLQQDPQNELALYLCTEANGAFLSLDGGTAWQPLGAPFAQAHVDAIDVHPTEPCTISVAAGKKIFRTEDCARSWQANDFDVAVTALAIDVATPSVIYAGNTQGDIIKSTDGGKSWRAIHRLDNPIERILIAPKSGLGPSIGIYVATRSGGLFRSTDDGRGWTDLRTGLEQFPGAFDYRALALAPSKPQTLLHASPHGLLRSNDAGTTWESLPLITAPGTVDITSLAVSPKDPDDIVYTTAATFYRTSDGGRTWESKKLPTARRVSVLHVDATNPSVMWIGTRAAQ